MRQQEVFIKIGGIIRELNEQYAYMQSAGDLFNDLELELMAANAHFLSDHVEILRKISRNIEKPPLVGNDVQKDINTTKVPEAMALEDFEVSPNKGDLEVNGSAAEKPVVFEFNTKATNQNQTNNSDEPEPEIIRHELILDDTADDWDEEDSENEAELQLAPAADSVVTPELNSPKIVEHEVVAPQPEVIPVNLSRPEPATLTKSVAEEQQVLTLNERMSAQLASRKADHLAPQPIADLKSAITLNDKLIFIKDLFNGYSLAYSEALDILNRMHSFEEAENYLKNSYAVKNNWADRQTTADKFYTLLQRRYL